MSLTPQDWSLIADAALSVLAVLFPGVAVYAVALKRGKDEVLQVLDLLPIENREILKRAQETGKQRAAKQFMGLPNAQE